MSDHSPNRKKNVVILSTSYWNSPLKFRRHQWATLAAENGLNVYYVNPTFTIASFVQDTDSRTIFWDFFKKPLRVNEHLLVLTMPPLLPFQRKYLWIDRINRKISRWLLQRRLKHFHADDDTTIIVYEPNDLYRILTLPNALLVYECVDEHSAYPFNEKVKETIIATEQKLLQKADILSVTSLFLLEKKKAFNKNYLYVPNGVNFQLFNSALKPETEVAPDIKPVSNPVVLYVGAIMEWFDYDLVLKLAENENLNIVLIGPQTINQHLFKNKPNIHMLGVKKQSDLPKYLKKVDVCIIPFLINDLVKGVNPLKLYEYLAAGKPVVSTALPDVIPFAKTNFVHIGYSHKEFIDQVDYLLKNAGQEQIVYERTQVAREYSWENLYRKLFGKIEADHAKRTDVG
jgi:glycosyltransferase involved in cell wall biosynthesis